MFRLGAFVISPLSSLLSPLSSLISPLSSSTLIAVTPLLVIASFCIHLATEHIQAVAHVQHGVRVDAVIPCITTTGSTYPTFIVALLSQQVVEVQRHNQRLALQEGLGYLTVPYQFVGVRRRIVITPSATLMQITAHLDIKREA